MSRPVGPPPYTAEEIAHLDTPEKRFIAQAELNSYIMGHKLADLRDQGLLGAPTYNLTNNNGAAVGFRRGSSPLLSDTPDVDSNEDYHSSSGGNTVGPQRGRPRNRRERGLGSHRPYSSATSRNNRSAKSNVLCQNFTSTALCKRFLYKHICTKDTLCSLSHDVTPENTPHCIYFLEGRCTNSPCMFAHVNIDRHAPVCTSFGRLGYCDDGNGCAYLHVYECPDFANTGVCAAGEQCSLKHVHHASRMKAAARGSSGARSPGSPGSSVHIDGTDMRDALSSPHENHAITQQHDYVKFESQDWLETTVP